MAPISLSAVHVDAAVTALSIANLQSMDVYVADKVFPSISVSKQSDFYWTFEKGDLLRGGMGKKAPGAAPNKTNFSINPDAKYSADVWAEAQALPFQTLDNADDALNLKASTASILMQSALITREQNFMTSYFQTGVWSKDITGVPSGPTGNQVLQWNDQSASPIENIRAGMTYVQSITGRRPNTLTLAQDVWDALQDHDDVLARIQYGGGVGNGNPARASKEAFAAILGLERVLIAGAVANVAEKGAADDINFIGSKQALLSYSPTNKLIMEPSAGYTFRWSGFLGSQGSGIRVKAYDLPTELEAHQIEVQLAEDQKLVSADCGYFFTSIIA